MKRSIMIASLIAALVLGAGTVLATATCSSECGSCSGDTCSVGTDGTVTCEWDSSCGENCTVHHRQVIRCPDDDFGPKDHVLPKLPS